MRLGDPSTISGQVTRFGTLLTHDRERIETILLTDLQPALYGREHVWVLLTKTLNTLKVQIGDRVSLRARPRAYVRRDSSISIGLSAPSAIRVAGRAAL